MRCQAQRWTAGVVLMVCVLTGCATKPSLLNFSDDSLSVQPDSNLVPTMWSDYETAFQSAGESGRPVMLFFTGSDWCPYCVKLVDEVLETPDFQAWADENIEMVEVDFPRSDTLPGDVRILNESLRKQYEGRIKGYPTALFVDSHGNVMGQLGYQKGGPEPWIEKATAIISPRTASQL